MSELQDAYDRVAAEAERFNGISALIDGLSPLSGSEGTVSIDTPDDGVACHCVPVNVFFEFAVNIRKHYKERLNATCCEIADASREMPSESPMERMVADEEKKDAENAAGPEPLRGECRRMDITGEIHSQSFVYLLPGEHEAGNGITMRSRALFCEVAGESDAQMVSTYCRVCLIPATASKAAKGVCMVRDGKLLGDTLEWGTHDNDRIACAARGTTEDRLIVVELREVT